MILNFDHIGIVLFLFDEFDGLLFLFILLHNWSIAEVTDKEGIVVILFGVTYCPCEGILIIILVWHFVKYSKRIINF